MNFAFNLLLFAPVLRRGRRAASLAAGLAIPAGLTFWRNYRTLRDYEYVFSWDGLATRSDDYGMFSTLVVQAQPTVQRAAERFYETVMPTPEWMDRWDLLLFMGIGVVCVLLSRRIPVILAGGGMLAFFLVFDHTHSSHFFRVNVPLVPVFLMAIAMVVGRAVRSGRRIASAGAWALVGLTLLAGAGHLTPQDMYRLDEVTPPPGLLTEDAYMVTGGFYQPESLVYRYPETDFVGMPLDPQEFERFRKEYREYRAILIHDVSIQGGLARRLLGSGRYEVVRAATNRFGHWYLVLEEVGDRGEGAGA